MQITLNPPEDGKFKIQYKNIKTDEVVDVVIPEFWKHEDYIYKMDTGDRVVAIGGTQNQFMLIGQNQNELTFIFYEEKNGSGIPLNCYTTQMAAGDTNVPE